MAELMKIFSLFVLITSSSLATGQDLNQAIEQYVPFVTSAESRIHFSDDSKLIRLKRKTTEIKEKQLNREKKLNAETQDKKINRLLGIGDSKYTGPTGINRKTASFIIVTYFQNLAKFLLPFAKFYLIFPKIWLNFIAIPFAIFFAIPSIRMESAEWYIQPFPIRIIQALFPLFSRGDWNILLFLRASTPLFFRLLMALVANPTGPYKFPRKFVGLLPSKARPHIIIRLPDGEYKRIGEVIPYLLKIPKIQLPKYIYENIMKRMPPNLLSLQYNLGIPTIVKKPWQILGIFPRYFPEGPENYFIKVALLLLRIGAPLIFITYLLNPYNVPGAVFLSLFFTFPSFFTFNPLRWLNPLIILKFLLGIKPRLPIF